MERMSAYYWVTAMDPFKRQRATERVMVQIPLRSAILMATVPPTWRWQTSGPITSPCYSINRSRSRLIMRPDSADPLRVVQDSCPNLLADLGLYQYDPKATN